MAAGGALPLFGSARLVLVRGVGDLPAKAVERLKLAVDRARAAPGGWPVAGTTVVFVAAPADRRAPVLRLLPESEQVEVRAPASRALPAWVRERARDAGVDLGPAAAQALVDLTGEDLGRLAAEVEKAALYAGEERRVSEEAVRELAGETRVRQLWELTQALEEGRRPDALAILERLLAAGEEPVALLAWVSGYVHNLWRALGAMAEGGDARRISQLLKPRRPEWAVERVMARAAGVGAAGLAASALRCYEVERRLKGGGGHPRSLLTLLVAELAGA